MELVFSQIEFDLHTIRIYQTAFHITCKLCIEICFKNVLIFYFSKKKNVVLYYEHNEIKIFFLNFFGKTIFSEISKT